MAEKGYRDGLEAVRGAVDRGGVKYSDSIIRFFEKNGSWEDISRVISMCENFPMPGMSLLSIVDRQDEFRSSAKAMWKLGRKRVADILSMNMPTNLWNAVIAA